MNFKEIDDFILTAPKRKVRMSLFPGAKPFKGVSFVALRKVAKRIAEENCEEFVYNYPEETLESQILKSYAIGYYKGPLTDTLTMIDFYLPHVHDWATSDALSQNFISARKNRAEVFAFLEIKGRESKEFTQRFVAVTLLSHFIEVGYIIPAIELLRKLDNPGYYTKMGVAWALAEAFAFYPETVRPLLTSNFFSLAIRKLAVKKCLESFRISAADKAFLRALRLD